MTDPPPPVALDQPPGSPDAVADAAVAARAAAQDLEDMGQQVAAARLPGWRGADAEAAARQCATVARLAAELGEALHRAAARLASHADLWTAVRARIAVLQAEQDEDYARARPLDVGVLDLADLADLTGRARAEAQARLPVEESRRAAEHGSLVAHLADDRAATRAVVDGCLVLVGAEGRPGTHGTVLSLAGVLPGWRVPELGRRARALVDALVPPRGAPGPHLAAVDALVRAELPFASDPAYASAFFQALGRNHAPALVAATWTGTWAGTRLPDLLGGVLSGLDRAAAVPSWLTALLDDAMGSGMHPGVVGGLAAALAGARRQGLAGPPPALAAAWAGTVLAAERARGPEVDPAVPPPGADPLTADPLALLLGGLVGHGASVEAAGLLASSEAWAGVLGRGWQDHGELVDRLVRTVADAPAPLARPALRSALLVIGTGLEDCDPVDWPAQLLVVERAAAALSAAVTRHVDDVRELLAAAAAGTVGEAGATVLRGLSVVLAVDRDAEDAVAAALAAHPSAGGLAASVAESSALAAAATHGGQLVLAMQEYRRKAGSEARGRLWDVTFGIPFALAQRVPVAGRVAGVVESLVTRGLGTNGYHVNRVELDPGGGPLPALPEAGAAEGGGRERQAVLVAGERAFTATRDALGEVRLPEETDPGLVRDLVGVVVGDMAGGAAGELVQRSPVARVAVSEIVGDEVADRVRER